MSDDESSPSRAVIGISFGNTHSSIAFTSSDGNTVVMANEDGQRQIPSILSYKDGEQYHGKDAREGLPGNPNNTVAYFRDFIGQDFKSIDPTPCAGSAHPKEQDGKVAFTLKETTEDTETTLSVSEITSRYLKRLQASAANYLGKEVSAAVVTIPTNFSDAQKEVLTKAAKEAGIEVLQYIYEPVASVLAYDAQPEAEVKDKIIVVVDVGGIRSDVTVIAARGGMYSILATVHDYDTAGAQFDQVIIDYFATEFINAHVPKEGPKKTQDPAKIEEWDPRKNPRALAKLLNGAQEAKAGLSNADSAKLGIDSLHKGAFLQSKISRFTFDSRSKNHYAALGRLALHAVEKANLDPLEVTEVICAGGSSNTPRIARSLRSVFPEGVNVLAPATTTNGLNPSELAVRGAAIQASLIQEFEADDIEQSTHPMVTAVPHLAKAIGVLLVSSDETKGLFRPVIEPETPVPVRRTVQLSTPREGGDVLIKVVEGVSSIKLSKPPPREASDEDSDDDDEASEDEPDVRERVWKAEKSLAEAALRGVKKGAKVEVQINVAVDLSVTLVLREVGGPAGKGVRGEIKGENGVAS